MNKNIMIVGVGGQGSLLASRIIGHAALSLSYDVKVSEVHGMSQRGGSVVTYVRYGDSIASPVICEGEADIILSFEVLEAARWLSYLRRGGTVITSTQEMNPMPVVTGSMEYPTGLVAKMRGKGVRVVAADALSVAEGAGNKKASNVALIGLASDYLGFGKEHLRDAVVSCVPEKFKAVNLAAFDAGAAAAGKSAE